MRSRIIVATNGQTLVARGNEYIAPSQGGTTVLTSRQFDDDKVKYRGPVSSQNSLDRAWIYGNPRKVSPSELKRAKRLEKARALPQISVAEAISIIEAMKRADEVKAKQEARQREIAELDRLERIEEEKAARRVKSAQRLAGLAGLNKAG